MSADIKNKIKRGVVLAPYTTLGVGGPANYFLAADLEADVISGLEFAKEKNLPVFVLGGGSNILVSDDGFDGLVIHIKMDRSRNRWTSKDSEAEGIKEATRRITAGAGENWDEFVSYCVENELAGVECLSGIPGTVGGTPVQNVGAYGQEVAETIVSVRCIDRDTHLPVRFTNEQCVFSYRKSIFNSTHSGRYIVCDVTFELKVGGEPKIVYRDLVSFFGADKPNLRQTRDAVLSIRRAKSMVIDQGDPNSRSAGSFFKNPIIPNQRFDELQQRFPSIPSFSASPESVKVPAAWLIENAGFSKGYVKGNAGISNKHSLAIVNLGNASSIEIIALMSEIQTNVSNKFDIHLEPEPLFVGS